MEEENYRIWKVIKKIPKGRVNNYFDVREGGGYFEISHLGGRCALSDPDVRPTHALPLEEIEELVKEGYLIEETVENDSRTF